MDEGEDSMFKLNLINECDEQSINFAVERLNSKNNQVIYDTVIQIKNLIIGNNKYKTFYLKEKIINRLLELINDYYLNYLKTLIADQKQPPECNTNILIDSQFIDLINQILTIFGSFSLGNLDHLTKLIRVYSLHEILFNLIRLNQIYLELSPKQASNLKLIESCLRALSNLYSSCQLKPSLVYQLDKHLYSIQNSTACNLQSLIKLFPLSNLTKQTVLNIITISSCNLMISTSIKSDKINLLYAQNRSILIKSDFIRLFSALLTTSLQTKIQLNCLKFYSSICFECIEATRMILSTNFYDYSLLDLISSFLSRENSAELQLYAAKCLTNLCRSSFMLKTDLDGHLMDMDSSDLNNLRNISYSSQLIKFKTLPTLIRLCSTYSSFYRNTSKQSSLRHLNTLILIETISTLSYLIELSSDLQHTASCLEQVIHIVVLNILNGYNNLKTSSTMATNFAYIKPKLYSINRSSCTSLFSLFYLYYNQFTTKGIYYKLNEHQYRNFQSKKQDRVPNNFVAGLEVNMHKCLVSVCFQALACLASNNEESRRVISENSDLLNRLVESIEIKEESTICVDVLIEDNFDDLIDYKEEDEDEGEEFVSDGKSDATLLRISSLCLLHSLSRSVHQLRTRFLDSRLWSSIVDLIQRLRCKKPQEKNVCMKKMNKLLNKNLNEEEEEKQIGLQSEIMETQNDKEEELTLNEKNLISILIAILANLLIEFSPCKETLISDDVIKILIDFISYRNKSIKINSIWALMNLAYHSEQKIKQQILAEITMDKLFQLLTEQDEILVIKTLGLIRNLICNRPHIDHLMYYYGNKIIQAIIMILESEYYDKMIKEQALCILANIADGNSSKEFIMGNEDLLRKINSFMTNSVTELQVAAVYCVSNLVNSNDEGALERQTKLKEIGAHRILQKLLHSNDPILFEKVKTALQQFSTITQT